MTNKSKQEHYLIAKDNGVCLAQVLFRPIKNKEKVEVVGILCATSYVSETMETEKAREYYKHLRDGNGWVKPLNTPLLTERQMLLHIRG